MPQMMHLLTTSVLEWIAHCFYDVTIPDVTGPILDRFVVEKLFITVLGLSVCGRYVFDVL